MPRVRDVMGTGASAENAKAIAGSAGAITAAGTSQAAGTLLSYESNAVTTASSQVAVTLPTGAQGSNPGDSTYVLCVSSDTCTVYPGGSDTINGSTSAVNVAQNKQGVFKRYSNSAWGFNVTA